MELKTVVVAPFVGGQAEIQNQIESYVFRGEIESIAVEGEDLRIRFRWLGRGSLPLPEEWVVEENLDYAVSISTCAASNIGPSGGETGGSDRLFINTGFVSNEIITLFPPDGSKMDPAKVRGLVLAKV